MRQHVWQLQEAKNRFSQVVEQALEQGPQIITRHGVEAVIVLSFQEYRRMLLRQSKFSDFFHKSPLAGQDLDLRRDRGSWRSDAEL